MNLGDTNNGQISCGLCHIRKHKKCDKISDYGNVVLLLGNKLIRQALVGIFLLNKSRFGM